MVEVEKTELKRRVRAAWSYSLLDQDALAKAMDVSPATLRGWLRKEGPRVPYEVALRLADACRVPREFIARGWQDTEAPARSADFERRLSALEERLGAES